MGRQGQEWHLQPLFHVPSTIYSVVTSLASSEGFALSGLVGPCEPSERKPPEYFDATSGADGALHPLAGTSCFGAITE